MQKIIDSILLERKHCYFISPHLDDAVLSAGGLIQHLASKVPVTLVTVFTDSYGADTLSARQFLRQCRYHDARQLFSDRRQEDKLVAEELGVEVLHLGFPDALWRERPQASFLARLAGSLFPEFVKLYPTYRFHIACGDIVPEDQMVIGEVATELARLVAEPESSAVFCPQGIGSHIDHVIVRSASEKAFPKALIGWADFPYNVRLRTMQPDSWRWSWNIAQKQHFIRQYRTQAAALFPDGIIPIVPEEFRPI